MQRVHAGRGSFAACVGAAVALNLVAIGVFAAVTTRSPSAPSGATRTSWITTVKIDQPAAANELLQDSAPAIEPATPRRTTDPTHAERMPLSTPILLPTQAVTRAVTQAPPQMPMSMPWTPTLTLPTTDGEPTRFYGFGEVDRPAEPEPESDWNLDAAALDVWGVQTLVFDIFISRTGEVIDCQIVEPDSLPDEARQALLLRVRETVLQPAVRHEMAVASVRRIEIAVAAPGP